MRYKANYMAFILLIAVTLLSACGTETKDKNDTSVSTSESGKDTDKSTAVDSGQNLEDTADSNAKTDNESPTNSAAAPKYLPSDLPIPDDAVYTDTQEGTKDDKKTSMVIYRTKEKLETLGESYKKYFSDQNLEHGNEIIDKANIIMNGEAKGKYTLSITGSQLASEPGTQEIIIQYDEL